MKSRAENLLLKLAFVAQDRRELCFLAHAGLLLGVGFEPPCFSVLGWMNPGNSSACEVSLSGNYFTAYLIASPTLIRLVENGRLGVELVSYHYRETVESLSCETPLVFMRALAIAWILSNLPLTEIISRHRDSSR